MTATGGGKGKGKTGAKPRLTKKNLVARALGHGALRAKVVDPKEVETAAWVRWKCRFGCGAHGSTLMCPPYTPEASETREMLDDYSMGVLFEGPRGHVKRIAAALERELFLEGCYKALGLGAGPCSLCETCAFDEGCRHPYEARPAMEACGIDVYATLRKHGFEIEVVRDFDEAAHFFGLVLVK